MEKTVFEKIYQIVADIPPGRVATYGQVALLAGNPRWARVVGYALFSCPADRALPCHRVVNRLGQTAEAFVEADGTNRQVELLKAEGVGFLPDGRVDLKKYSWFC